MSKEHSGGMSRRDFGKAAAAAASFAILSSRSGIAQDNSETLRVGLIGCGGRGGGAVVNHLTANENVKFVAMADVFEDKLTGKRREIERNTDPKVQPKVAIEDELCFVGLDAYEKLLQTDIDILIHATPPYCRPDHIEAAVNAGKHIFTEKPIAVDAPGTRKFMAASEKAKEKGLSLVAGTQRRHQKSYIETIEKIHNGEIGDVVAARAYWCGTLPFSHERQEGWSDLEYRLRNWYNYCWVCGDNIVEQHIHNIDVINWVMNGHPVKVMASGGRAWKPLEERYGNIFDHFSCDYEYENGVHLASFSRHWNDSANEVSEFVVGTKGSSRCRDMGRDDMDPYVQEHIDLMASIRGTGPYLNEGIQVAESTFTAIMGREAGYTGKELKWDEALNSNLSLVPKDLSFEKSYPMGDVPVPGTPRKAIG